MPVFIYVVKRFFSQLEPNADWDYNLVICCVTSIVFFLVTLYSQVILYVPARSAVTKTGDVG